MKMVRTRLLMATIGLAAVACQSEAERLQGETLYHLENAIKILEDTPANTDAAIAALDKYLAENRERLALIRASAESLLKAMDPAEREAFARKALERARPLRQRIENLARTYPDPPRIMQKIQQFL